MGVGLAKRTCAAPTRSVEVDVYVEVETGVVVTGSGVMVDVGVITVVIVGVDVNRGVNSTTGLQASLVFLEIMSFGRSHLRSRCERYGIHH